MNATRTSAKRAALWRVALAAGLVIELVFIVIAVGSLIRGNAEIPAWQQLAFVAILVWIYIAYLKQRAMDISSFVVDEKIKAHSLVENLEEGIILTAPDHRILLLNRRAAELTGLSEIESLERNLLEEVDETTRAMLLADRAGENACTFVQKSKTVRLGVKPLASHASEEPHKLIRVYEAARAAAPAAAEPALETRAVVETLHAIIEADTTPPRLNLQARSALITLEQASTLAAIRERTLASRLAPTPISMRRLLNDALDPLRPILTQLDMTVEEPPSSGDAELNADPALSAIAFSQIPLQAALIGKRAGPLTIKTSPMGANMGLLFRLSETKPEADISARLFEAPGLFLARGIVEAHGGSMWAETPDGGGLNITLMWPLASG